jgi:hypothetical protein
MPHPVIYDPGTMEKLKEAFLKRIDKAIARRKRSIFRNTVPFYVEVRTPRLTSRLHADVLKEAQSLYRLAVRHVATIGDEYTVDDQYWHIPKRKVVRIFVPSYPKKALH